MINVYRLPDWGYDLFSIEVNGMTWGNEINASDRYDFYNRHEYNLSFSYTNYIESENKIRDLSLVVNPGYQYYKNIDTRHYYLQQKF